MEAWVPLFDIFLNSPSPEFDASLWFSSNSLNNSTTTTSTNSFLKLLSKPIDTISTNPSSSIRSKRFMYIQTLPDAVQSRILSFLTTESKRFCKRELCLLAENVLNGSENVDFWVKKSAHNLLDKMSDSGFLRFSSLNLNGFEEEDEEFFSLPSCLQSSSNSKSSVLPWLPLTFDELRESASGSCIADESPDEAMEVEELCEVDKQDEVLNQVDVSIDSEVQTKAGSLKMKLLDFESAKVTVSLADEIRQLCFGEDGKEVRNSFAVLGLIEPWEVDDETASILITNLLGVNANESEFSWGKVLCSIILPKLLVLDGPASRVLVTTTIESCKPRQKAAVDALLFPLILRKEGLNTHICDVMSRIIKECLHPAHVSSFCQRLLCGEEQSRKFICLPCHQHLVSDKLVWTEPLFTLFQNILNQNIPLTQDSIEHLVSVVQELAGKYSKSLKFSIFFSRLVTKCHSFLEHHKLILIPTVC
ncbi:hypothetical protein MKW92_050567 [Papaver armeniacum]|nr:hypothetical protein MKW92_050567 [Papaver armeniacum]